jgi:L-threonylcarbamoyladenylate synthase
VYREFGDEIDFILAGNLGGRSNPSEIRDAATNQVLRSG